MNKFKNETFEEWAVWKLPYIPPCQEGTNGEGEKSFFNALLACAKRYPERTMEWAEMVNEARCQPLFSPGEIEHKVQDALGIADSAALTGGAQYIQNTKKLYTQPTNNSSQNGYHLLPVSEVTKEVMQKITSAWLWWRSPIVPDSQSAASFLARLYEPGEKLYVTTKLRSKEGYILEAGSRGLWRPFGESQLRIQKAFGTCLTPLQASWRKVRAAAFHTDAARRFLPSNT